MYVATVIEKTTINATFFALIKPALIEAITDNIF